MAAEPNLKLGDCMEGVSIALHPLTVVLWADRAIQFHGAPIVCDHYMFVVRDADMEAASTKLLSSGFTPCSWSYGSISPDFYTQDAVRKRVYKDIVTSFAHLDDNSLRYFPPARYLCDKTSKIVLLPASYAHINFEYDGLDKMSREYLNILNPDGKLLVRSFVQTLLREPTAGQWTNTLRTWAISYAYGELRLGNNILDDCADEEAQTWFDHTIERSTGGLDCVTITKRVGRKPYRESRTQRQSASPDDTSA